MIVRSLRVVNLRGIAELDEPRIPQAGLVQLAVHEEVDPVVLQEVVRYAFLGDPRCVGDWLSPGASFGFVEVGFELGDGALVSVFRGRDGRDSTQASLREEGGRRLTSGEDDVAERLTELLGGDLERWDYAACPEAPDEDADPLPLLTGRDEVGGLAAAAGALAAASERAPTSQPLAQADVEAARAAVDQSIEGLRRAVQLELLVVRADRCYLDLVKFGEELAAGRGDVAKRLQVLATERERVRGRLRRLSEYRSELELARQAQPDPFVPEPAEPAQAPATSVISWYLEWVCLAGVLMLVMLFIFVLRQDVEPMLAFFFQTIAGLCCVAALVLWWYVLRRRAADLARAKAEIAFAEHQRNAAPPPTPRPAIDWRGPVRARYVDLDDPDDPEYGHALRERVAEVEHETAPLSDSLEQLDDVLALHESELARAARALGRPVPDASPGSRDPRPDGGARDDAAERHVRSLGDAIYEATVEHEALLTSGAETRPVALAKLRAAFQRLARALRRDGWGDHLIAELDVDGLMASWREADPLGDAGVSVGHAEVWGDLQRAVDDEISAAKAAAGQCPDGGQTPAVAEALRRIANDLERLVGQRVPALTGLAYDSMALGPRLELVFCAGEATASWEDLPPDARARARFGMRTLAGLRALESDTAGESGGRVLFLPCIPHGFDAAEDVAAYLGALTPEYSQVLLIQARRRRGARPLPPIPLGDPGATGRGTAEQTGTQPGKQGHGPHDVPADPVVEAGDGGGELAHQAPAIRGESAPARAPSGRSTSRRAISPSSTAGKLAAQFIEDTADFPDEDGAAQSDEHPAETGEFEGAGTADAEAVQEAATPAASADNFITVDHLLGELPPLPARTASQPAEGVEDERGPDTAERVEAAMDRLAATILELAENEVQTAKCDATGELVSRWVHNPTTTDQIGDAVNELANTVSELAETAAELADTVELTAYLQQHPGGLPSRRREEPEPTSTPVAQPLSEPLSESLSDALRESDAEAESEPVSDSVDGWDAEPMAPESVPLLAMPELLHPLPEAKLLPPEPGPGYLPSPRDPLDPNPPLDIRLEPVFEYSTVPGSSAHQVDLLLSVQPQGVPLLAERDGPAAHVILALDVSASMNRLDKYPVLMAALKRMLRDLAGPGKSDVLVSVVLFARGAATLVAAQPASLIDPNELHYRIERSGLLFTRYTDFAGAMARAGRLAHRHRKQDKLTPIRIYLLTDGRPQDMVRARTVMEQVRKLPVDLNGLAFGDDADVGVMRELLGGGRGGTVKHIRSETLGAAFRQIAESAQQLVATRALIDVKLDPGIVGGAACRYRPARFHFGENAFIDGRKFRTDLGTLEAGRSYSLVFRLRIPPANGPVTRVGRVTVRVPGFGGPRTFECPLLIARDSGHTLTVANPRVMEATAILEAQSDDAGPADILRALRIRRRLYEDERRDPHLIQLLGRAIDAIEVRGSLESLSSAERATLIAHTCTVGGFGG